MASLTFSFSDLQTALSNRFEIERELGRGGVATVYLARDRGNGRALALQVLHPEVSGVLDAERFAREIAIAGRLRHPHILPIHDSGSLQLGCGSPVIFCTMPYVAGKSLRDRLDDEPQLPLDEAVMIARQSAEALDHAHREGIIHGDIRPENILLAGGQAVVAGFGIVRALDVAGEEPLTETGLALGTPAYMSPEQGARSTLDGRSDIYSLGCVLYEMLAGQPPFTGPTAQAVLARHASDPVPSLRTVRPTVGPGLDSAVMRALAKAPADRFTTGAELRQALERSASSPTVAPASRQASRRPLTGLILGISAVALLAVLGAVHMLARRPPEKLERSAGLVAVLPFRISGASPELAWLRDGLVDLLAIHLTGEGGFRAADPRRILRDAHQWTGTLGSDPEQEAVLEAAERLGAARLIEGSVVGAPNHLVVTASLIGVPSGKTLSQASVDGALDSIGSMVRRLAADLSASEAGQRERLGNLGSLALPTLRAFLDGQAALREARWKDAFQHFARVLDLDSTFPQAAMGLMEAEGWNGGDSRGRGAALAWAYRDRLGRGDRALLSALLGPTYPYPATTVEVTAAYERAIAEAPDRPEAWYHLGENYYHWGAAIGLQDARGLAARAFRRAIDLDSSLVTSSSNSELMIHLRQIAAIEGDTEAVRASRSFDWRTAQFLQDSASLERLRAGFDSTRDSELTGIVTRSIEDGIPPGDAELAVAALIRRATTENERAGAQLYRYLLAMNGGRPQDAAKALGAFGERSRIFRSITDALYWGGDSALARAMVSERAPNADAAPARAPEERLAQQRDMCLVEQWRLAHGELGTVPGAIKKLRRPLPPGLGPEDSVRATSYASICADILEAWLTTLNHEPAAPAVTLRLDSLLRQVPPGWMDEENLAVARLLEAHGHIREALAAVRRRRFDLVPWFTSSFLREEGRLAALAGDTAGAIKAYHHYLVLRPNPEAGAKPEVERVREELAALLEEPGP